VIYRAYNASVLLQLNALLAEADYFIMDKDNVLQLVQEEHLQIQIVIIVTYARIIVEIV